MTTSSSSYRSTKSSVWSEVKAIWDDWCLLCRNRQLVWAQQKQLKREEERRRWIVQRRRYMEFVVDNLQCIGAGVLSILVLMATGSLNLVLFLSFIGLCGILLTQNIPDIIALFNDNKLNILLGIITFALAQITYWTLQGLIFFVFSLSLLPQSLELGGVFLFFGAIALVATYAWNGDNDTDTDTNLSSSRPRVTVIQR